MTPDQEITIWSAALTALPAALFTGLVAYWTWKRDQERIIVQKAPVHIETSDGIKSNATLMNVGVVVTNLSLYPVRVSAIGFSLDGKVVYAFARNRQGEKEWPAQLGSHARMAVYPILADTEHLRASGVFERVMDWKLVAVVLTETGRRFSSNRLSIRVNRPLRFLQSHLAALRARMRAAGK